MELLVGYIVFVVVAGIFANQRGRNPILWGLIATVISPIGAGIILALLPDIAKLEEQSARELAEQKNRIEQENKEREIKETSITGGEILKKSLVYSAKKSLLPQKRVFLRKCLRSVLQKQGKTF